MVVSNLQPLSGILLQSQKRRVGWEVTIKAILQQSASTVNVGKSRNVPKRVEIVQFEDVDRSLLQRSCTGPIRWELVLSMRSPSLAATTWSDTVKASPPLPAAASLASPAGSAGREDGSFEPQREMRMTVIRWPSVYEGFRMCCEWPSK